jgi:hypothetical protein
VAKIGTFGGLSFAVSSNKVSTFDDLKWDTSAAYATHDRHLQPDLLEFLGPDPEQITFKMKFSVFLGVNPLKSVNDLRRMVREGTAERLVIGGRVYGDYKWAITKVSSAMKTFDNRGNCWAAEVTVTLKEYGRR